jgi:hypothetical protein
MVSAKHLHQGMAVVINSGTHVGRTAKVIDPEVVPDGQLNQRKVLVEIDDPDNPWREWIIPKQLDVPGMHRPTTKWSARTTIVDMDVTPITSLDDPSLDQFRPRGKNLMKKYVSRTLPGGIKDIDALMKYWSNRDDNGYSLNVGMVGDTQSGKTMLVDVMAHVVAKEMGLSKPLPVFTLSGSSGITDYDLFGQPRQASDGTDRLVWMEGIVARACRVGGILYLDEVNAMPGNVTSALHPITDDRRQFVNLRKPVPDGHGGWQPEVVNVNPDLWVMCTYNPGYSGMSKTNEAFANRFEWLQWDYDEEVEAKLIKSPAIRMLGQALRLARETRAITTPVGTSALQRLERNLINVSTEYALWAFMGQFTSKTEKSKVDAILTDRGIKGLLEAEFNPPEVNTDVVDDDTNNYAPDTQII